MNSKIFKRIIIDLFDLPDDLCQLLYQFIPSKYVNILTKHCHSDYFIDTHFVVPVQFIELDWDKLSRHEYCEYRKACIQHNSIIKDCIFTIPDLITIGLTDNPNNYQFDTDDNGKNVYICNYKHDIISDGVIYIKATCAYWGNFNFIIK